MTSPRIILASRSPRRRMLLEEAGWEVEVLLGQVDDGALSPEQTGPAEWTTALAWLKARAARDVTDLKGSGLEELPIIAGDTVCEHDGVLIGQPGDAAEATDMIYGFRSGSHRVWTGLCLLLPGEDRRIGVEFAEVWLGDVSDADIEVYVASEAWRGKAGGYNLRDRIDADWPIRYEGHPSTIMGLPLPLLERLLKGEFT
ncbi:MAG: Maf family protein [Phycisphaerales bacterium]|nr:Maf family protein [Phycisphaerales bacterium]MDP6891152.1 Maf family protein [Phycisphaerales bacterium]